jgi:tetratricopeptide (TPR) repeat protein
MIEALRELIMIWPESRAAAVARLRLGRTLLSTEGSQARRFLFELLGDSLAPTTERAEAGLLSGRSYLDQGDLVGALRSLEYARDLAEASDPEFAERAKAYLTLVLLREGELPAAVEAATELRAAVDDEARRIAAEVEARAQLALGRPNMAARAASMWVSHSIPKKRSRALGVLGHSLHAAGRSISALAVYKLSRLEGNYREWSSALPEAKLLTEIGRWTEAQRLLKNALESALEGSDLSRQLELRLELARVTLKVDGPSSAKPIIASVALDPQTHPDLRAKAYEMLATLALAREDAQEALDLYTALASDSLAPMSARRKALDARFSLLRDIGQEGDALLAARGIVWRGAR